MIFAEFMGWTPIGLWAYGLGCSLQVPSRVAKGPYSERLYFSIFGMRGSEGCSWCAIAQARQGLGEGNPQYMCSPST